MANVEAAAIIAKLEPVHDNSALESTGTGQRIQEAREALGIYQKVLAAEMAISQPFLCDLEKGHRCWTMHRFLEAKAALTRLTQ